MVSPLRWLLLILVGVVVGLASSSSYNSNPSRMIGMRRRGWNTNMRIVSSHVQSAASLSLGDYQTYNYTQTLDHFNYDPESYTTFEQKYVINSKYWGGANTSSPIFVWAGQEAPLEIEWDALNIMLDIAPRFKALLLYIEHRYYGSSMPFGSEEEAYRNSSTLGYLTSTQALADYAELIVNLKNDLSAENCPVFIYGGSYGGMLAAWFRLKYPHIAMGALASSAPILYFEDLTPENGYYSVVSKDFKDTSESCYSTIRQSWFDMDEIASLPQGLQYLTQKFKVCSQLNDTQELKDFFDNLYCGAAQYNYPPLYPVTLMCKAIDAAQENDTLGRIMAGAMALYGDWPCIHLGEASSIYFGWGWQSCSEMVMPIGRGENDTMFQAMPFDLKNQTEYCQRVYGVTPRPHWITTEFGGHDIKTVLEKFASNIIFSNGLRDPYSVGGSPLHGFVPIKSKQPRVVNCTAGGRD
ncbi:hypothetical protein H6P81_001332 [Aristolochia fimbriata]|uniref:Lysosomal Pro-X carboxypeptidase n=1 Tax=Aristolochia fimbriata TaxID=158543 RepID=A0AAV7F790_ARIFI|nr:hypothetical protein H6P81_001332 [Aristolochia fimbriata]